VPATLAKRSPLSRPKPPGVSSGSPRGSQLNTSPPLPRARRSLSESAQRRLAERVQRSQAEREEQREADEARYLVITPSAIGRYTYCGYTYCGYTYCGYTYYGCTHMVTLTMALFSSYTHHGETRSHGHAHCDSTCYRSSRPRRATPPASRTGPRGRAASSMSVASAPHGSPAPPPYRRVPAGPARTPRSARRAPWAASVRRPPGGRWTPHRYPRRASNSAGTARLLLRGRGQREKRQAWRWWRIWRRRRRRGRRRRRMWRIYLPISGRMRQTLSRARGRPRWRRVGPSSLALNWRRRSRPT
jgi:hypothetical protein